MKTGFSWYEIHTSSHHLFYRGGGAFGQRDRADEITSVLKYHGLIHTELDYKSRYSPHSCYVVRLLQLDELLIAQPIS